MMDEQRDAFIRASWANVGGNILKIVVEGGIGLSVGSLALIADAAHSLADLLASLVVLVWGRLYFEGPDSSHPHGHERVEPLTALFVGTTLVLIGLAILYDTGRTIIQGTQVEFSVFLVLGLGFAMVDMLVVYVYTKRLNEDLNSPSLAALAKDCLNDIYTSIAAVVGVVGISLGYPVFDPIAGGVVSLVIVYEGAKIGYENVEYLAGGAPPKEKQEEILNAVRSHPAVRGVHDFAAHYIGPVIEVEMHIEIDGNYTLREAHDIETEIRNRVIEVPDVYDVHIHLDPAGIGEWKEAKEPGQNN